MVHRVGLDLKQRWQRVAAPYFDHWVVHADTAAVPPVKQKHTCTA